MKKRSCSWNGACALAGPMILILTRPRLFGLLGRDESLTIPWQEIETIGTDAILVHTALPEPPPQAQELTFWQKVKKTLGM